MRISVVGCNKQKIKDKGLDPQRRYSLMVQFWSLSESSYSLESLVSG